MISFTKEQQDAIDYFDTDLVVSASAGSGKTRVMLEKVVKLVEMGYKLSQMVIVTFTNLASSEMKTKLENLLQEKFSETGDEKFFRAIQEINVCDISTIHSFCQKLVKKYYYVLDISPNFSVGEENFLFYLKMLAIDKTFEKYFSQNDEEFISLANLFAKKRDYNNFREEILSFYEFLISKVDKYNFIKNLIEASYNENLNENVVIGKYRNFCEEIFGALKNDVLNLKLESEMMKSEKLVNFCDLIFSEISFSFVDNKQFINRFLGEFSFPTIRIGNKSTVEEVEIKEKLQALSKEIKAKIAKIQKNLCFDSTSLLLEDNKKSKKILLKFSEVTQTFEEFFIELKRQNNILDFNDLENLTLQLLDNEKIENEIIEKFRFVFVDEYQDTNFVQEEILKKLSKKSKRIMVGDLKQSIYAFRECNPKILKDKMAEYVNYGTGKVIELNKNFRSRHEILSFSNEIFSNLMRQQNCDYEYEKHGMFVCGRDGQDGIMPVLVINVDKEKKKDDEKVLKEDFEEKEFLLVLNAINDLLKKKIDDDKGERNLTYSDIAIISRKRGEKFSALCAFLSDHKVPINVKFYEKIYESKEAGLVLSFLKIINNPSDEVSLCAVLKNVYGLGLTDLLKIKKENFIEDVFNFDENGHIKAKIDEFRQDIAMFRELSKEKSVKELILEIIKQKNLDLILLKRFGKISQSRLDAFLANVDENEYDIKSFVNLCEKLKDKKTEIRSVDGDNSVIIDTFHGTKGLEYNAVIILGAGDEIFSKTRSNLIYNASLGVGIYNFDEESKTKNPNFIFSLIKTLNKKEEFNEETRLLYVALTRAKNYLTVIGCEKQKNLKRESEPVKFLDFSSYLNLICASGINENFAKFLCVSASDEIFNEKEVYETDKKQFELDYFVFDKLFLGEYKFKNSTKLQLKNSVTGLSEDDQKIYNISHFKLTDLDKEDYIEIGNCYHLVLEKIPFSLENEKEIRSYVGSLIEKRVLPANVYSFVSDEKILKAIKQIYPLVSENDVVRKEQSFVMEVEHNKVVKNGENEKILVQGIIDLMIEKDDEILLIDYKTSRLSDYNLIKKYAIQLNLYELAIKEKFKNKPIKKFIYSIYLDKLINVV